jgi:SAM-dependent methyltransferase
MFTEMFAKTGARIVAVDLSPDLLMSARSRGLPQGQVKFVQARIEDWSSDDLYDAVIGSSVLHHLDLRAALNKMFELLRPGRFLAFAEPNMLNPQVFTERRFRRYFPYVSEDETAFVRWRLRRALEDAGFTNVRIEPFDWLHPATPKRLIPFVRKCSHGLERLWPVREFAGSLLIEAQKPQK